MPLLSIKEAALELGVCNKSVPNIVPVIRYPNVRGGKVDPLDVEEAKRRGKQCQSISVGISGGLSSRQTASTLDNLVGLPKSAKRSNTRKPYAQKSPEGCTGAAQVSQ